MKLEDYNEYYIQGSDHYLIPKDVFTELFNEMINWKEESKKQKEVIDKANKELNEEFKIPYQDLTDININNLIVERNTLIQENQQLKIQISAREEVCNRLENNWNKLKEWLNNFHKLSEFKQWEIVNKMQEIEKGSEKYKLKDGVSFNLINKKSIIKFDFDLSDYYNKETRIFEFPKGYVAFSLMGDVFNTFLFPLDLVEKVDSDE